MILRLFLEGKKRKRTKTCVSHNMLENIKVAKFTPFCIIVTFIFLS